MTSVAASIPARTSDQEFSRRALRLGIDRLGLTLEELLRRASCENLESPLPARP